MSHLFFFFCIFSLLFSFSIFLFILTLKQAFKKFILRKYLTHSPVLSRNFKSQKVTIRMYIDCINLSKRVVRHRQEKILSIKLECDFYVNVKKFTFFFSENSMMRAKQLWFNSLNNLYNLNVPQYRFTSTGKIIQIDVVEFEVKFLLWIYRHLICIFINRIMSAAWM